MPRHELAIEGGGNRSLGKAQFRHQLGKRCGSRRRGLTVDVDAGVMSNFRLHVFGPPLVPVRYHLRRLTG
jgi:hypothetical protein